jgi:hypothetical protein
MDHAAQESSLSPLERERIERFMQPTRVELASDKDQDEMGSAQRLPEHLTKGLAGCDAADVNEDFVTREAQRVSECLSGEC